MSDSFETFAGVNKTSYVKFVNGGLERMNMHISTYIFFTTRGFPRLLCSKLDLVIIRGCVTDNNHWLIICKESNTYIHLIGITLFMPVNIYIGYKNIMSFTYILLIWMKVVKDDKGFDSWKNILAYLFPSLTSLLTFLSLIYTHHSF